MRSEATAVFCKPRRAAEAGFTAAELMVSVAILSVVTIATLAFLSTTLAEIGDQHTDTSLFQREHTTMLRIRDDVEDADYYDSMFQATSTTLRFREVIGTTSIATRIYGNTITYTLDGPVTSTGGLQLFQLTRTERDSTNTTLIRQNTILSDLTAPDDAASPSRFSFAAPFVNVQLVGRLRGRRVGETVTTGLRERIRLRY